MANHHRIEALEKNLCALERMVHDLQEDIREVRDFLVSPRGSFSHVGTSAGLVDVSALELGEPDGQGELPLTATEASAERDRYRQDGHEGPRSGNPEL